MQLVSDLAKKIINEVRLVLTENIIVINHDSVIIASTDDERIGSFHEGAFIVMETKEKLYITKDMSIHLQGVKPGITLPIIFENEVIGSIGITGIPNKIEPFAELIRRMTELIIREATYLEKKEWEMRGLESFFYEWIYNQEIDDEFINRGQILGINLQKTYICMLFQLNAYVPQFDLQQIQTYMNSWFNKQFPHTKNDVFIRWGNERFILLKDADNPSSISKFKYELSRWKQYFKKTYHLDLVIGVAKTIVKKEMARPYHEASKALKVAYQSNSIIFYESLLLEIIIEEVRKSAKFEFINKVLLTIQHEPELMSTLESFYEHNLSIKKTAEAMHIHINTLHYRLKQIHKLSGIDPKSSYGVSVLFLALTFLKQK
ncbi:CdaR family transcriptional regulator [Bacillus solitudinis]|uniref:CdaR family transcriptional regulator n=1 Tax=Bacillus solitudinis TaxID=2014074 RepID=UPI0012FD17E4|nr:sugar diacid recognition domain-containing protein [Bacillus solitudinis]